MFPSRHQRKISCTSKTVFLKRTLQTKNIVEFYTLRLVSSQKRHCQHFVFLVTNILVKRSWWCGFESRIYALRTVRIHVVIGNVLPKKVSRHKIKNFPSVGFTFKSYTVLLIYFRGNSHFSKKLQTKLYSSFREL